MKKLVFVTLCMVVTMRADSDRVTVDVRSGSEQLCQIELERGDSIEIERSWNPEADISVHSNSLVSRVGTSLVRTVADSPFLTAIAIWALVFCRDSIQEHPYKSMFVGGILFSDFALHLLHSADQKVFVAK